MGRSHSTTSLSVMSQRRPTPRSASGSHQRLPLGTPEPQSLNSKTAKILIAGGRRTWGRSHSKTSLSVMSQRRSHAAQGLRLPPGIADRRGDLARLPGAHAHHALHYPCASMHARSAQPSAEVLKVWTSFCCGVWRHAAPAPMPDRVQHPPGSAQSLKLGVLEHVQRHKPSLKPQHFAALGRVLLAGPDAEHAAYERRGNTDCCALGDGRMYCFNWGNRYGRWRRRPGRCPAACAACQGVGDSF